MSNDLSGAVIDSVDWSLFDLAFSDACGFGDQLRAFLSCGDVDALKELWHRYIENRVFCQDDISSAAVPTVRVLFAALASGETQRTTRSFVLDLLFLIAHPAYLGDDKLALECREAVRAGIWLLVQIAITGERWEAAACLEILVLFPESDLDQSVVKAIARKWHLEV